MTPLTGFGQYNFQPPSQKAADKKSDMSHINSAQFAGQIGKALTGEGAAATGAAAAATGSEGLGALLAL